MSLPFADQSLPRRSKTILSPEGTTAKFLYTILKQLDLKTIDWNEVASQLDISNGHAARMRYSRFKGQIENLINEDHAKAKSERKDGHAKQKEKRKHRHEDLQTDQKYPVGQLRREQGSSAKRMRLEMDDLYEPQIQSSVLKTENPHDLPHTTILNVKTEKGTQQARVHHPAIATVTEKDREGKFADSNRIYDHNSQGRAPQMQQGFRGQHNSLHGHASSSYTSYPRPPVHAHTRYPNWSGVNGYHHISRVPQSQQVYGSIDPATTQWYHGSVAQQQPIPIHPQLSNLPYWGMGTTAQMPWQYSSGEMLGSAQALDTSLPAIDNVVNENDPLSTLDLAQFAAEFGDWNGVAGNDVVPYLTVTEEGNANVLPALSSTVTAQSQGGDLGATNVPLQDTAVELDQTRSEPSTESTRNQSHDSSSSKKPDTMTPKKPSDDAVIVNAGRNIDGSSTIKPEIMEAEVKQEPVIEIEIL